VTVPTFVNSASTMGEHFELDGSFYEFEFYIDDDEKLPGNPATAGNAQN